MPARIGNVTFDCDDVLKMAAFWSAVLGRPVDKGSSELFPSIGGADGTQQEPAWYYNKVPESKRAKNRVHLDLVNPDPSAIHELVRLGATVTGEHEVPGHPWTVLQHPEGNEFCIAARSFTGWGSARVAPAGRRFRAPQARPRTRDAQCPLASAHWRATTINTVYSPRSTPRYEPPEPCGLASAPIGPRQQR